MNIGVPVGTTGRF